MDKNNKGVKIQAKNYDRVGKNRNFLYSISLIFAFVVAGVLAIKNYQLEGKVEKRGVIVAVNDKLYNAVEASERSPSTNQYYGIAKTFMHNMFSHNYETFDINTSLAEPLVTKKSFLYIKTTFQESDGSSIKDFYKKHDAQTLYEMDSIVMEQIDRGKLVYVYGKRRAIFANTEDFVENFPAKFRVVNWRDSEKNPFGLIVSDFNFLEN